MSDALAEALAASSATLAFSQGADFIELRHLHAQSQRARAEIRVRTPPEREVPIERL